MIILLLSFFLSAADAASPFNCETTYDHLNIPHVSAQSVDEMYYCMGLHHGQDRAWEMDYFRRTGQGRNSEVLGFSQLKSDLMMRLLDLSGVAEKLWQSFPAEKKKFIEIYAAGVNKGFETGKKSREFLDLDYEPEPWKGSDSILVLLLQSFDQTRKTFLRDYDEEVLKEKFGINASGLFDEDHMPWENTILKDGEYEKAVKIEVKTTFQKNKFKLWGEFPELFGKESGSNNWVISRKKSKTGHAILANDPHLDLKTPMFWYWISLKSPYASVVGGTVPGVPVIASGTNGKVSWGLTNSYLNAADAVVITDLDPQLVESFRPSVWIKLGFFKLPFFFKSFEKLKSGHKVLPLELDSEERLVLRWTGFSLKAEEVFPMFDIFKVQDVKEMDKLLNEVGVPSWNFVFADNKGDIGYRVVGKTFLQTSKNAMGVQRMTFEEFSNEQYLPKEDRPHLLNPGRNYIYSANNRHWPSDSKYYGGRGYSYSFRGFRIDQRLKSQHDIKSMQELQCDRQVVDARFFMPSLKKYLPMKELENWDMFADENSKQLPVYRRLMDIIFEKWTVNEYALIKMLRNLNKEKQEQLKEFYQTALKEVNGRTWGEILKVKFSHLSKNEDWVFSPEIPGFGDTHTVDPGTARWNEDLKQYEQSSGASMRMIIEMQKDKPKIWLALPGLNRGYDKKPDHSPWIGWKNCQYSEVTM